ncbi:MAG: hypothetical protein HPY87_10145 [Fervidobacterium sp.]|uniref:DNA methyltransferase n=1 Tax=Fervidobacterium sp. TaxID=1871331 RepID=UPI003418CDA6|nr:hypothetical protein [Fervidobacterium sp.]
MCKCDTSNNVSPCYVLDPFNGSGTTGVVAMKYGLKYTGIDIVFKNMLITRKRLSSVQQTLFY